MATTSTAHVASSSLDLALVNKLQTSHENCEDETDNQDVEESDDVVNFECVRRVVLSQQNLKVRRARKKY